PAIHKSLGVFSRLYITFLRQRFRWISTWREAFAPNYDSGAKEGRVQARSPGTRSKDHDRLTLLRDLDDIVGAPDLPSAQHHFFSTIQNRPARSRTHAISKADRTQVNRLRSPCPLRSLPGR